MPKIAARAVQRRLGERLQLLRRQRGYTQESMAQRCGLSQKYLSELERGEKTPSWDTLVALAHRGFEVRLATLLFAIDEEFDPTLRGLDEMLAGRPADVRYDVLNAVRLLLRAGENSER